MILMATWETMLGSVHRSKVQKGVDADDEKDSNHRTYQWWYRRHDLDVSGRMDRFYGGKYIYG